MIGRGRKGAFCTLYRYRIRSVSASENGRQRYAVYPAHHDTPLFYIERPPHCGWSDFHDFCHAITRLCES